MSRRIQSTTLVALVFASVLLGGVPASRAAAYSDRLSAGETLSSGQYLTSPDGSASAIMQSDGNFVVYRSGIARFASGTFTPGSQLIEQFDGNLVVYTPSGQPVFNTRTPNRGGDQLIMQNDGNLVQYAGSTPLWSIQTGVLAPPAPPPPASIGDTLGIGSTLQPGQRMVAGSYQAIMQSDGNFVVYANSTPVFSTGTAGRPGARLSMQSDGNLVLYYGSSPIWYTNTSLSNSRLVLQADGNLVVYGTSRASWSRFSGKIAPPSIPGDGAFFVPREVPYGTYRAAGSPAACYWETDDRNGNIVDNAFTTSSTIMTVTGDVVQLTTERCMTFYLVE